MKTLLIALGLTAVAVTLVMPAHAYYLRDCLRGAPCPGFNAPSPRYLLRASDTMSHPPTMLRGRDTMIDPPTMLRAGVPTTTTTTELKPLADQKSAALVLV